MASVIFIDNQDSFTYNIVDELEKLNHCVTVYRNTVNKQTIIDKIKTAQSEGNSVVLFFSPGPGKPSDVLLMSQLLSTFKSEIPIIGVCLGHQAITEFYGGVVGLAPETIHGKSSRINLQQHPIFAGLTNPFTVARYHSLVATKVPQSLTVIGEVNDLPMAVINEKDKVLGFQFHPESVLTTEGATLLQQSINYLLESER